MASLVITNGVTTLTATNNNNVTISPISNTLSISNNGAMGARGLSNYEIWLSLGNIGTEEDFLATIGGSVSDGVSIIGVGTESDPIRVNWSSPNLTDIPTAPTAPLGTSSNQIATTEFVHNEVDDVINKLATGTENITINAGYF